MIRQRRGLSLAAAAAAVQWGPLYKFRLVVACPPGELVNARAVLAGQSRREYQFGPGDTGWIELEELHQLQLEKLTGATATVELWWADQKDDRVYAPGSVITSPIGSVLYDSGSVAAGAAIDSGVLDLSTLRELAVIVDNTAGTVIRDLSLVSYLADGATQVDSVVLRRCAFGAAPTGATHAPGAIRGAIGPNPPGGISGHHVLFDATSGLNAANNTGPLCVEDMDAVKASVVASAGTTILSALEIKDDLSTRTGAVAAGGAAVSAEIVIGVGVPSGTFGFATANATGPHPVPRLFTFNATAAGAGNTTRLLVTGRGRVPGTFSVSMVLPTRAKLTLGAGGAGAARLTVIGR